MEKLNLKFIDNQTHGYLKISIPDLKKYTNQRPENYSEYSFYCPYNDCLYLEEDCDLSEFSKYIENKGYITDGNLSKIPHNEILIQDIK